MVYGNKTISTLGTHSGVMNLFCTLRRDCVQGFPWMGFGDAGYNSMVLHVYRFLISSPHFARLCNQTLHKLKYFQEYTESPLPSCLPRKAEEYDQHDIFSFYLAKLGIYQFIQSAVLGLSEVDVRVQKYAATVVRQPYFW